MSKKKQIKKGVNTKNDKPKANLKTQVNFLYSNGYVYEEELIVSFPKVDIQTIDLYENIKSTKDFLKVFQEIDIQEVKRVQKSFFFDQSALKDDNDYVIFAFDNNGDVIGHSSLINSKNPPIKLDVFLKEKKIN